MLDPKFMYLSVIENTTGMPQLKIMSTSQGHIHKY